MGKEPLPPPERRLVAAAARDPRLLDPASFALLRERNPFPAYPLHPWPILLTPEESRSMQESSVALVALAQSLPRRFFGGDPARIAEFYGLEGGAAVADLVLGEPNGLAEAIFRGDYLVTPDGLRCLEINGGSGVSGWRVPSLGALYAELPALADFLRLHGLRLCYRETFYEILAHILGGLRSHPGFRGEAELDTVVAVRRDEDAAHRFHSPESQAEGVRLYAAALAAAGTGGHFAFSDYDELEVRGGRVYRQGRRVHALFEQHADRGALGRQLFGSFKAGRLALYSGPVTRILMDKANLALMSEHQDGELFDETERRLVRSLVPWTRRVLREETGYRGQRVFLPDLFDRERQRLVLKRGFSHSGKDVHLGRDTPAARWSELAAAALAEEGRWVVQEALDSVPYELLDEELGVVPHDVVWGLYAFGGGFRGGFLRVAPRAKRTLLNVPQGARTLPFLEIEPV